MVGKYILLLYTSRIDTLKTYAECLIVDTKENRVFIRQLKKKIKDKDYQVKPRIEYFGTDSTFYYAFFTECQAAETREIRENKISKILKRNE